MKTYSIEFKDVLPLIDREVSRAAAAAYAEDGTSLYDVIRITSRDKAIVDEMVALRMVQLMKRLRFALATIADKTDATTKEKVYTLNLSLSDSFKPEVLDFAKTLIVEYMVKGVLLDWCKKKGTVSPAVDINEVMQLEEDIVSFLRTPNYLKAPLQPFGPKKSII